MTMLMQAALKGYFAEFDKMSGMYTALSKFLVQLLLKQSTLRKHFVKNQVTYKSATQ